MRIGINARCLKDAYAGIANYLSHIILNLKNIDDENDYILFFGRDGALPKGILDAGFSNDIAKMPTNNLFFKMLWNHIYLPNKIKENKIDLFHEPSFITPIFKKCTTVVTVHDIAYMHIPECYTYRHKFYFRRLLSRSIDKSDLVIAVSESTKRDIIDNLAVDPNKIRVVYEGVDEIYRPYDDELELEKVKKIYGIQKNFILSVSGISPRKNYIRLIKAVKMLKDEKNVDIQLVIVGENVWWYEDVFREVSRCGLDEDVIFCGYIPQPHLLCLYNSALIFVHPSLYEGFSFPVLEAMACGCPVAASNVSSIPEVCGSAALLFDPRSVEGITASMRSLITDDSLRRDLIKKGIERVKKFSWKKAAEETLAVYKSFNNNAP